MGAQGLGGAGGDGLIVLADCPRSGSICVEKGGDGGGGGGGDLSVVVSVLMINSVLITDRHCGANRLRPPLPAC